jgi:hypothetical protein
MTPTTFFRLLHVPIDVKGDALAERVAAIDATGAAEETYTLDPSELSLVPRSPFAYWTSQSVREIFAILPPVESEKRAARIGDHPGDKERYVRLFWEVSTPDQNAVRQWLAYQKGGYYSPFYADTHLVVDWDLARQTYYDFHGRPGRSSEHPSNYLFFFRPGVNWPLRTQKGLGSGRKVSDGV